MKMIASIDFDHTLPVYEGSGMCNPEGWKVYIRPEGSTGYWQEKGCFNTKPEAIAAVEANGWEVL